MAREPAAVGAYGLALTGVDPAAPYLVAADPDWVSYRLINRIGHAERLIDHLSDEHAELRLRSGGEILIDRAERVAEFVTPRALTADELVHPYLAPVAAVVARWLGRDCFHAGAFAADGDLWALLADREGGKSTTLAWLAANGFPILCDDMLILDQETAYAGPRVLDLRAEAAERLGAGDHLGVVGARERWRLHLGDPPSDTALRGWIFLTWGADVAVERVGAAGRLARLLEHQGLRIPPARPERFLELAALPAWELRRPRGWARFDDACRRLLAVVAG